MQSVLEIARRFRTQKQCLRHLEKTRWPDGLACLRCGSVKVSRLKCRYKYECGDCQYQFSATVGTIFHNSKVGLPKWFLAIHLPLSSRKGYSSCQLSRDIGVTQKTAWSMLHRIRMAMENANERKLSGIVEMDETFLKCRKEGRKGQRPFSKSGADPLTHATIFGIRERNGEVRLTEVANRDQRTLYPIIDSNVDGSAHLMTDEARFYRGLIRKGYRHSAVLHAEEYVDEFGTHCNGVESIWAVVKRGRYGVYHKIGRKYLHRYLNEYAFRLNAGLNGGAFITVLLNSERGFDSAEQTANPRIR